MICKWSHHHLSSERDGYNDKIATVQIFGCKDVFIKTYLCNKIGSFGSSLLAVLNKTLRIKSLLEK